MNERNLNITVLREITDQSLQIYKPALLITNPQNRCNPCWDECMATYKHNLLFTVPSPSKQSWEKIPIFCLHRFYLKPSLFFTLAIKSLTTTLNSPKFNLLFSGRLNVIWTIFRESYDSLLSVLAWLPSRAFSWLSAEHGAFCILPLSMPRPCWVFIRVKKVF